MRAMPLPRLLAYRRMRGQASVSISSKQQDARDEDGKITGIQYTPPRYWRTSLFSIASRESSEA